MSIYLYYNVFILKLMHNLVASQFSDLLLMFCFLFKKKLSYGFSFCVYLEVLLE